MMPCWPSIVTCAMLPQRFWLIIRVSTSIESVHPNTRGSTSLENRPPHSFVLFFSTGLIICTEEEQEKVRRHWLPVEEASRENNIVGLGSFSSFKKEKKKRN